MSKVHRYKATQRERERQVQSSNQWKLRDEPPNRPAQVKCETVEAKAQALKQNLKRFKENSPAFRANGCH